MAREKIYVVLDQGGGFILPKSVRDKLKISPGDSLRMQSSDGRIVLRPLRRGKKRCDRN
jgi:AbrB family looped-hinge helix DNA binding protein